MCGLRWWHFLQMSDRVCDNMQRAVRSKATQPRPAVVVCARPRQQTTIDKPNWMRSGAAAARSQYNTIERSKTKGAAVSALRREHLSMLRSPPHALQPKARGYNMLMQRGSATANDWVQCMRFECVARAQEIVSVYQLGE